MRWHIKTKLRDTKVILKNFFILAIPVFFWVSAIGVVDIINSIWFNYSNEYVFIGRCFLGIVAGYAFLRFIFDFFRECFLICDKPRYKFFILFNFFGIIISLLTLIYCENILQMGRLHDNFIGGYTFVSIIISYYYTMNLLKFFYDLTTEKFLKLMFELLIYFICIIQTAFYIGTYDYRIFNPEKINELNRIFQINTAWGLLECIGNGLHVVTGDFKNGECLLVILWWAGIYVTKRIFEDKYLWVK